MLPDVSRWDSGWAIGKGGAVPGTHSHVQDIPETHNPQLTSGKAGGKAPQPPPAYPGIYSWIIQVISSLS